MPHFHHVTPERLRLIAATLSDREDQAAVMAYADELELLSKSEFSPPKAIPLCSSIDPVRLGGLARIMKTVFPPDFWVSEDDFLSQK